MRAILGVALALAAGTAAARPGEVRLTRDEIAALAKGGAGPGSSGVAGIQTTVLMGDPTAPGPYAIELRVPANTRIAAHRHRDDRSAVVIEGDWYFGYGPVADETAVKRLGPGGFYAEPADAPHFALTRATPAVVYITGVGPTDTVYQVQP